MHGAKRVDFAFCLRGVFCYRRQDLKYANRWADGHECELLPETSAAISGAMGSCKAG
jgi:hypothetical protein|tara:strand:- start:176 stop:346 length:171 start_codon:yes stop_codon:yes gene_type:complete